MKNSIALKIILGLCGLLIFIPGAFALFSPVGFTARNGIDIVGNIGLLNDYRGLGGMMLGTGIIIILGLIHSRMAFTSTVVAAVLFISLSLGRVLSLGLDGMPVKGMVAATLVEAVLGLLAVFALVRYRESE